MCQSYYSRNQNKTVHEWTREGWLIQAFILISLQWFTMAESLYPIETALFIKNKYSRLLFDEIFTPIKTLVVLLQFNISIALCWFGFFVFLTDLLYRLWNDPRSWTKLIIKFRWRFWHQYFPQYQSIVLTKIMIKSYT